MLEGTISNIPPQGGRKHPEQQYIQMDTTHILFITGGTFTGLNDIIKRRLGRKLIGFASENHGEETVGEQGDILAQVQPEDLIHYGMIPEFVGRLPCIAALSPLDEEAMVQILTEPRNALVKQYQRFFRLENTTVEFSPGALRAIAHKAMARDTGARALRAVVEEVMLDVMYDLPEQKEEGAAYEITEEMISGQIPPSLFAARKRQKESA
jgi:ATP-dependent Clp protease ATP-binding subunit ClpX